MKKIEFKTPDGFYLIDPADILYIETSNRHSKLTFRDNSEIDLAMCLKECIELLPKMNFYPINRSVIINVHGIFKFTHIEGRRGEIIMDNRDRFEVSRRQKNGLVLLIDNNEA